MPSTDTELNQTYPNGILPNPPPATTDREQPSGILKQLVINNIVNNLKTQNIIPTLAKSSSYEVFASKQEVLLNNINNEYNFYKIKYETALNNLFTSIRTGYDNNTTENQQIIRNNLTITQTLNRKLNDLTQIINGITTELLGSTSGLNQSVKKFEDDNKINQDKLKEQNKIITSSQATTELNKRMVKYTEEKAKYSNNLLGLYSFLNVVAVGLLVYVYKSSNE
jgi:uncharacterized protein YoxC